MIYQINSALTQSFIKQFPDVTHISEVLTLETSLNFSDVEKLIYARSIIRRHYESQNINIFATHEDTKLYVMNSSCSTELVHLSTSNHQVPYDSEDVVNLDEFYPVGYIRADVLDDGTHYIEFQLPSITCIEEADTDYATSVRINVDPNKDMEIAYLENTDNVLNIISTYKYFIYALSKFLSNNNFKTEFSFYPPKSKLSDIDHWLNKNAI